MSETAQPKAVERFADAQTGDWLWLYDGQASVYDENRKYLGRGTFRLVEVIGRTRQSLIIEEGRQYKFNLADGMERIGPSGAYSRQIMGRDDRFEWWWIGQRWKLAEAVRGIDDVSLLRRVALAINFDEAPPQEIQP